MLTTTTDIPESNSYAYIGLCYGTPGVGKTLSARHFCRADLAERYDLARRDPFYGRPLDTAFCTASVVNSPARVTYRISSARERLAALARSPMRSQARIALDTLKLRTESYLRARSGVIGTAPADHSPAPPDYFRTTLDWETKVRAVADPTTLVVIDEADRLRTDSLEQVRSIFDEGGIGVVLIGMPGLEKRMARYPQLYSRIGFVHQFHPLDAAEMYRILERHWNPRGVTLPAEPWSEDAAAVILRITGGNFRLLNRLLSQTQRVLEINGLKHLTKEAVETARESLVIGAA